MRFLSLDPGGTTGFAIINYGRTQAPVVERMGQIEGGLEGFIKWYDMNGRYDWSFTVCESFILRPGVHGADITPAYVIGALEALEAAYGAVPVYQKPSQKKLCEDDVLKRIGMYQVGKPHANDAIRHGIIYLRNQKHLPTLKLAWGEE